MNLQNWVAIAESGRVQREQKMELALKELGLISHEGLCIEECKTLCKALQIKWNGTKTIKKSGNNLVGLQATGAQDNVLPEWTGEKLFALRKTAVAR